MDCKLGECIIPSHCKCSTRVREGLGLADLCTLVLRKSFIYDMLVATHMQLQCIYVVFDVTSLQAENEVIKGGKTVYDATNNLADLVTTILNKAGVDDKSVRPVIVGVAHFLITNFPGSKEYFDAINIVGNLIINVFEKAGNFKIEEIDLTVAKPSFLSSLAYDSAICIYRAISAYVKMERDISSAQDEEEKNHAKDEFTKAVAACIGTGVFAVVGSTIGAVIGSIINPLGGAWAGGLVGNYVGRNLAPKFIG